MKRIFLAAVLAAMPLGAGAADLGAKLDEARAAVERILAEQSDVETELEAAELNFREAEAAARTAQEGLEAARASVSSARTAEAEASARFEERLRSLGPRLAARYRVIRQGSAGSLLLSDSPASLLRGQHAFDRLLAADLEALRATREARDARVKARAELEVAEAAVVARSKEAELRLEDAMTATQARQALLASIRDERRLKEKVVRDLERSQARLTAQVAQLQREPAIATTGFGAMKGQLGWPVDGAVLEVPFGKVINAKFNTVTFQNGLDLRIHEGAEVHAAGAGKVVFAGWFRGYGNLVIVDHGDGFHTLYAHLAAMAKSVGERVGPGELVGLVGDTGSLKGAYLYFEIRASGRAVDPMPWLERR